MGKFFFYAMITALLSTSSVIAQNLNKVEKSSLNNPPIVMESMVGTRGVMYQLIIDKKFKSIPKLGFFSVTNGIGTWDKEISQDIMTQAHLTYSLVKGLDITAGMQYTPVYGYRPVTSLVYSYAKNNLLFIVNPKIDIADDLASETMALIEYRPKIDENFSFYSRVQGLYGFVPNSGMHNRSYVMLRAGLSFNEFSFGAASNFDWYGPIKHNKNNFGVFFSVLIF